MKIPKSCILTVIFFLTSTVVFVASDDYLRGKDCSNETFKKHFFGALKSEKINLLMEALEIVPTAISEPPNETLIISSPSVNGTIYVRIGDVVTMCSLDNPPNFSWNCDNSSYYTLSEIDLDFRTSKLKLPHSNVTWWRENQWTLWLVVNIPGCNIDKGETIFEYSPPRSRRRREYHTVVFLVYKQPEKTPMKFNITKRSRKESRHDFQIEKFANQSNFGWAVAGNFLYYIWK